MTGMPNTPFLYADELIDTLKKKHKARGYKEMVGVPILISLSIS